MSVPSDEVLQRLGASLREIDPSALQTDVDEGPVRWFLGEAGAELFAWARQGKDPDHIELIFAQLQVEWTRERGIVTRQFRAGGSTAGGRYDPYLLDPTASLDREICRGARRLLEASSLPDEIRSPILAALPE